MISSTIGTILVNALLISIRRWHMRLSSKVNILVVLAFVASGLLCLGIQWVFIMPSFISLEKETAIKNAERVLETINNELNQVAPSASDWAFWTDTYNYMTGKNQNFVKENLEGTSVLEALKANYMGFYDTEGNAAWNLAIDLPTNELLHLGWLSEAKLPPDHPLLQIKTLTDEVRGIIDTPYAPMLVVAKPILTNLRKGPIAGTFILGRFLDNSTISHISKLTKLSIIPSLPKKQQIVPSHLLQIGHRHKGITYSALRKVETQTSWQIYTTLVDLTQKPVLALQIDTSRDISDQGAKAVMQSLWSLAATGLLMMFVFWKLLRITVLEPLTELTEHAKKIGKAGNLQEHIQIKRDDEIGFLSKTFNQMVDHLEESRQKVVDQSYRSGVAEMAGGVLHNIRNAITPLNVRLSTLQQSLRTAPLEEIKQASAELANSNTLSERRADLLQFVELAAEELSKLVTKSYEDVTLSIQQIAQIEGLLADQRRLTRSERVIEAVDMVKIINDVAAGLRSVFKDVMEVKITDSVVSCGNVVGARAALQQVVANVLINAAESIIEAGEHTGCITISASKEKLMGREMVDYHFDDNGIGVDPEHLEHLFERDFSTKHREGSGYGLHWSAITIQSLGGKMFVESAGLGHGASIRILLPVA